MATHKWTGDRPSVAKVITITISTPVVVGEVWTITIAGEDISFTATDTTAANVSAGLVAAWNASTFAAAAEITAADATGSLTLTMDAAGVDFHVTVSTDSAGGTIAAVVTTPNSGPNVLHPDNFDSGAMPDAGDDVIVENTSASILYALDAQKLAFTSGDDATGVHLEAGVYITGATGGATAEVLYVDLTSGSWTGGDAAGNLWIIWKSGTFQSENLDIPGNADCATIAADSAAVDYATRVTRETFTGYIGLAERNANGYDEYRPTYWVAGCASEVLDASGSGRIKLDYGSDQIDLTVLGAGTSAETNVPTVLIQDNHASSVVKVEGGTVGIEFFSDQAGQIATLQVGSAAGTEVICGPGLTLATAENNGGTLTLRNNVTTLKQDESGATYCEEDMTVGTLEIAKGTVYYNSSGTIGTALTILADGIFDGRYANVAATITPAVLMYRGAKFYDPRERFTVSAGFDLMQCGLEDVTLQHGKNYTWTRSAI